MKKKKMSRFLILFLLMIFMTTSAMAATTDYMTYAQFVSKRDSFSGPGYDCYAYANAYTKHVAGVGINSIDKSQIYYTPAELLPGDVIHIANPHHPSHWFVVLDVSSCSGNTINLYTGEGNWPKGKVTISRSAYRVVDNRIFRGNESFTMDRGYHVINSFYRAAKTCVEPSFYANLYPDLISQLGTNPDKLYRHFWTHGVAEGRQASYSYDVKTYLSNSNPDLKKAFNGNYRAALYHYITYGWSEKNRKTSEFFSATYYLDHQPDIKKAYGSSEKGYLQAAEHFNSIGAPREGRQGISTFNVQALRRYSDLQKNFGVNWPDYFLHYLRFGKSEGRKTT